MKNLTKTQQFGLYSSGIGAGVAAIAMLTDSLDVVQIIASTILILVGITTFVFGRSIKNTLISLGLLFILLVVGFFLLNSDIYNENQGVDLPQTQREALVLSYIEENISRLSPEPEVLGGTFYVTDVEFSGANSGTVEYEDGHIALVADFEYSISEEGAIEIEFTNVQENQP